ncbi:hypothetical protein GKZ68_06790 [Hymenobacter sp. BRD128]|uniref:hypothetical protein n=1 Tax=Hymenobacter sp. BRD128 TaxID=2675878 RepID=UPI001567554E|nr:hypothetical protein [Hymenobacter sp. BRD128]QKG56367.1 hypothetical protein GKZ68_06790 [Hymenobacter sp. BRD128]
MPSDNLDDLFRQQLGQHATPPGEDLQHRLAELAAAERLDAHFRTGLGSHASQPRRELWERLEDEHLHPQPKRRRVAWWQLSAAAVLLLTLLAGGLWRGGYLNQAGGGLASSLPTTKTPAGAPQVATHTLAQPLNDQSIANNVAAAKEKNRKNFFAQATAATASSSSPSIAAATRPRRAAAALREAGRVQQPDAATGQLATTGRRNSPASKSPAASAEALAVAPASDQRPPVVAVAMASQPEIVEVEVRRGPEPSQPAAAPVIAAAEPAPTRRPRLRLGGLLRQADHLVHGEPVSLAEATGLPETVTVQAHLGGRTLSKTVQL